MPPPAPYRVDREDSEAASLELLGKVSLAGLTCKQYERKAPPPFPPQPLAPPLPLPSLAPLIP